MFIEPVKNNDELFNNIYVLLHKRFPKSGEICKSIGVEIESADFENKTAIFTHIAKEEEINFRGTMHGGLVAWLCDTTMGILACAFARTGNPTLNISVNFIRGINPGEKLLVIPKVNTVGGHIITTECKIYVEDGDDKIMAASATGSFYRLELDKTIQEANNH